MDRLNQWLKTVVLLAGAAALIAVAMLAISGMRLVSKAESVLDHADTAVVTVSKYTQGQAERFRDPKNQKAIEAAIQTAAVYNATGRLINREVIPQAISTLDSLKTAIESMNRLVAGLDKNVNGELLPGATRAVERVGDVSVSTGKDVSAIAERAGKSIDEVNDLLADPAWRNALQNIERSTANVDVVTGQIAEASRQLPSVAQSVEKIAKTSSRYRGVLIFSQIAGILSRAFW